jgi:hypothetical protein
MSDRRRNAYFQAGHAIGARLEGLAIICVSIVPSGDGASSWIDIVEPELPKPREKWRDPDFIAAEAIARALLSGPAAEEHYSFGKCFADLDSCKGPILSQACGWRACGLARRLGPAALTRLWRQVSARINAPDVWQAVDDLAIRLLEHGRVAGDSVDAIVKHAVGMP